MELSLQTIFFLLVAFAVGAAVILFMIGHWIDLTGLRYKMESQRNVLNLIQLIVSSSPIVQETSFEPNKLVLDANKLDNYASIDMYGKSSNPSREKWQECCQFLDFDYKLTVIDFTDDYTWDIGSIPFTTNSKCYPKRVAGYADLPVVIFRDGNYNPGFINITLIKTPLSDLSFWLSQAFIRASWEEYGEIFDSKMHFTVPLDTEIEDVTIDKSSKMVCVKKRATGDEFCKPFIVPDAEPELTDQDLIDTDTLTIDNPILDCYNVIITVYPREPGLPNGRVMVI